MDLDALPDDACLNIHEVAKVLGITRNALSCRIKSGSFTRPDFVHRGFNQPNRSFWRVRTVRKYLKEKK